jgi:hypothetical protein
MAPDGHAAGVACGSSAQPARLVATDAGDHGACDCTGPPRARRAHHGRCGAGTTVGTAHASSGAARHPRPRPPSALFADRTARDRQSQPVLHRVQTHPVATDRGCIRDALHRRKRGRCHRGEQATSDEQGPQHMHKGGEILHPGTRHLYDVSGAMSSVALPSSPALTDDFRRCDNHASLARPVHYAPIAAAPRSPLPPEDGSPLRGFIWKSTVALVAHRPHGL